MATRAQVTSIEALETFRANLILFLTKARPTLEEISEEVARIRVWLQTEQRTHWEREMRVRRRKLEEAQQELFSAKLSQLQETSSLHYMAVQRARRALREAEAKRALVKKWERDLENRTEPFLKQLDLLHGFLASDMARAVACLNETIKTLEAYAEARPTGGGGPTPPNTAEPEPAGTAAPAEGGKPPISSA
jgi:hypothetical protein